MTRFRGILLAQVTTASLLVACASAPVVKYYEISTTAIDRTPSKPSSELLVAQVRVPDSLARVEMVVQKDAGESEVLDGRRWLSPMDDQINRALIADLQAELPSSWVTQGGGISGALRRLTLRVEVLRLSVGRSGHVVLEAAWSVSGDARTEMLRDRAFFELPPSGRDYDAIVPAISDAVQQLSKRIATSVAGL